LIERVVAEVKTADVAVSDSMVEVRLDMDGLLLTLRFRAPLGQAVGQAMNRAALIADRDLT